jgi:hypothetical protein
MYKHEVQGEKQHKAVITIHKRTTRFQTPTAGRTFHMKAMPSHILRDFQDSAFVALRYIQLIHARATNSSKHPSQKAQYASMTSQDA